MNVKVITAIVILIGLGTAAWLWLDHSAADEHGQAAYTHTEAILAFGPRTIESKGLKNPRSISQTSFQSTAGAPLLTQLNGKRLKGCAPSPT